MLELIRASEGDGEILARICRSVAPMYEPMMPGAFEKQAQRFEKGEIPQGYDLWLIFFAGQPIGFLGVTDLSFKITYLVALYLEVDFQGLRIGGQVLTLIKEQSKKRGVGEILLLAHAKADWAIGFYRKHGFQIVGRTAEQISSYADSILEEYYLPNTILLSYVLKDK